MAKKKKSSGAYMNVPVRSYHRSVYVPPTDFPGVSLVCIPTLGGEGSYSSLKIGAAYNENVRVRIRASAYSACLDMYENFADLARGTKGTVVPYSLMRGPEYYFEAWWPTQEQLLIFLLKAKQDLQAYVDLENNKR